MLNRPEAAGASVLVAGPDFGTGSSREHAVWALQDYGFRVVVSSRFADIFREQLRQGRPASRPRSQQADVERLQEAVEADPATEVTVDLGSRTVTWATPEGAQSAAFDIDDYTRWRLMEGLDDIGLTLRHEDAGGGFRGSASRRGCRRLPEQASAGRVTEGGSEGLWRCDTTGFERLAVFVTSPLERLTSHRIE